MSEPRGAADRLELTGAITIREIETVRRDLLAKLESKTPLEVDLSGVTETDISLIQLMLAAEKSGASIRPCPIHFGSRPAGAGAERHRCRRRHDLDPGEMISGELIWPRPF